MRRLAKFELSVECVAEMLRPLLHKVAVSLASDSPPHLESRRMVCRNVSAPIGASTALRTFPGSICAGRLCPAGCAAASARH